MAVSEMRVTKNYRLFTRSSDNRPLDESRHRRLYRSMQKYGFIRGWPIVCCRNGSKQLVVKDGQHRLAFAETLGLPVYFVVLDDNFDIADINNTQVVWVMRNYAEKFSDQGNPHYQEGLSFADRYDIPIGIAFALLAGYAGKNSTANEVFRVGAFKVREREWAELVGAMYSHCVKIAPHLKNARFIEALTAVARVDGFNMARLLQGADRSPQKLVAYSTRDAYLDMLEDLYNFGRKSLVPLKLPAIAAMRERNVCAKKDN